MTSFVVDASVVVKWFFPEEDSAKAGRLLSGRHKLIAPDLIWSEVTGVVWKHVRRGELTPEEASAIVVDLLRMPIEIISSRQLVAPALELAISTDRSVYDCLYLALAIDQNCRFVTADKRFVNALEKSPLAKHVQPIAKLR